LRQMTSLDSPLTRTNSSMVPSARRSAVVGVTGVDEAEFPRFGFWRFGRIFPSPRGIGRSGRAKALTWIPLTPRPRKMVPSPRMMLTNKSSLARVVNRRTSLVSRCCWNKHIAPQVRSSQLPSARRPTTHGRRVLFSGSWFVLRGSASRARPLFRSLHPTAPTLGRWPLGTNRVVVAPEIPMRCSPIWSTVRFSAIQETLQESRTLLTVLLCTDSQK
jgi:hypothetical protein